MRHTKKRVILYAAAAVISVVFIFLGLYLKGVSDYKRAVRDIFFHNIDVTQIADGTYVGECNVGFIYAKVKVTVLDGAFTNITILEHKNERGQAAESVIGDIVAEQRIEVDAITGATNSSTVLKKAVENAVARK